MTRSPSSVPVRRRRALLGTASLTALLSTSAAPGQEWTRFRGPNGSGVSSAALPAEWTEKDYNWKVKLPGEGISQPVLWGDRVFLTSAVDDGARRLVLCLAAGDGSTRWSKSYDSKTHPKHVRNSYASSTPAVDAERLYVAFSTPESYTLRALNHGGEEVWSRDLGPYKSQHGNGASPVVFEDLVVLGNEQDGESSLAALDRRTGEVLWKIPRRTEEVAYATPCVYDEGGRPALLFSSHGHGLSSLDPRTGAVNWEARLFDKRVVSSPIFAGGLAIGACGSGAGVGNFLVAVKPGGKGDVSASHLAYKLARSMPYVPTPLAVGDLLFLWGDVGIASCVELSGGKVLWQDRVGGNYSGSPVAAGDRVYCISEDGVVVVLAASREFKVLGRNPLGEGSRSTPAIAGGRLYLRTYSHLVSIGGPRKARPAEPAPPKAPATGAGGAR